MTGAPLVDILLATWNGAPYLAAQLDSILGQTHGNWRLLIRDDGSTDDTLAIARTYAARHPQRIVVLEPDGLNLGAAGNFSGLLERSTADYVMFCDQDDVWLPEKTDRLLGAILEIEAGQGADKPALVHCDLKVVDRDLQTIAPSFWRYQKLNPEKGRLLNRLLIQNVVTGCASMMNRALAELAAPVPADARMHDWWVALVAAAFGKVGYLPEPLVLYRQHGANTLGAKGWNLWVIVRLALGGSLFKVGRQKRAILRAAERQAALFAERHGAAMSEECRQLVQACASLSSLGAVSRRLSLVRNGFLLDGLKNAGLLVLI